MKKKWRVWLGVLLLGLFTVFGAVTVQARADAQVQLDGTCDYKSAAEVLKLMNQKRQAAGKPTLVMDKNLQAAAMQRAAEITIKFSHIRPSEESLENLVPEGLGYLGENIAAGYTTSSEVMEGWMSSPGHKANILANEYRAVGIGCFEHYGMKMWVQIFADKGTAITPPTKNKNVTATVGASFSNLNLQILTISESGENYLEAGQEGLLVAANINADFPACIALLKGNSSGMRWESKNPSVLSIIGPVAEGCLVQARQGGNAGVWLTYTSRRIAEEQIRIIGASAPAVPGIRSAKPVTGKKIQVKWNAVSGADGYRVYRRTASSGWQKLKDVSASVTAYTDSTPAAGVDYTYTVRAFKKSSAGVLWSDYENGMTAAAVSVAPPLIGIKARAYNQIQIAWNKVSGAVGYRVYRKEPGGAWQKLKDLSASATSYIDSTAQPGIKYTYTVRGYSNHNGKALFGEYNAKGLTAYTVLQAAQNLRVVLSSDGYNQVQWSKVAGAEGYRIYRRTATSGWVAVKNVTASVTSYKDKSVKPNIPYIYTVRALRKVNNTYVQGLYEKAGVQAPVVPDRVKLGKIGAKSNKQIIITWNKVSGAQGYRVFRKTATSGWTGLKDVNASTTSFTDSSAKPGVIYTYTVRAFRKNAGKVTWGSYDAKGLTGYLKLNTVKLAGISVKNNKEITIRWNKIPNITGYRIYRRTATSNWAKLKDVKPSVTSCTDTTAQPGVIYTYTVRGATKNGDKFIWSGYDAKGLSGYRKLDTVKLGAASVDKKGYVTMKWGKVSGADGYRVYRRTQNTGWKKLGNVSAAATAGIDKTAEKGKTYYYTVRAFKKNGAEVVWGGYDPTGVKITVKK